jgi:D-tyrosyl-tRNA(Tyr) deacylase
LRAVVQRVTRASVVAGAETLGWIGPGLVALLGVGREDDEETARYIVDKTVNLRIFADDAGKFDRSALDIGAELLIVSQFTLYGDTRRGRRPSFTDAAPPEQAAPMFERALDMFRRTGLKVESGRFQARMLLSIHNDGPVTIILDSADRERPRRRISG